MNDANGASRVLTDEEHARALREQLKSLHSFDLVYEMMVSLVSFGYQKLGLTGETAELRDLGDAHFAIEALGALLRVTDGEAGDAYTRDLHSTLAQMQLGYVQALELFGQGAPEPAAAEQETAAEPTAPAEPQAAPAAEEAALVAEEPAAEEPEAEPEKPAASKAATKKPAAKKPAGRKPAAKKPPAKKPPADAAG